MARGPKVRKGYVAWIAALLGLLLYPQSALAHGGDRPLGKDPLTGKPIISQRELAEVRAEFHAAAVRSLAERESVMGLAAADPRSASLPPPQPGNPQTVSWKGALTYTPELLVSTPLDGSDPCPEAPPGEDPECQEFTLSVPEGVGALYLKVTWQRPDYAAYLYAFEPGGAQHGLDWSRQGNQVDKRIGNLGTLPFSELTLATPAAGDWTLRVRAAWGLKLDYLGTATATKEPPIVYPRQDNLALADWATHRIPVNVVFAGIRPTAAEIEELRSHLPDQHRATVLLKQGSDSGPGDEGPEACTGANWGRCHFRGTYTEEERDEGGAVPYFEPIQFEYEYHFIQADDAYTRAAFTKMKDLTDEDARGQGLLPVYTARGGAFREPIVSPAARVDLIDAPRFEDWIFNSRLSFCDNFTDIETGEVHGGGFISPDTTAYYDPYYDRNGRNLDRMPQGRNEGVTLFFFDTYSPSYAPEYFDVERYHNFVASFIDPDTDDEAGINDARLWGGRYRFAFLDLGAAPNFVEKGRENLTPHDNSAEFPLGDPPIWEYRNNPLWQGRFIQQGLARNIVTMLFSRMTAGYLYRPIPYDVYQLATTNFVDYYSTEASGYGTRTVDLEEVYKEDLAFRWLSAAIPHATFLRGDAIPNFVTYRYLSCSDTHVGSKNAQTKTTVMLPDPTCAGITPDPLQRQVELAKAQGDDEVGAGIPFEQAVSASVIRNYWEANRSTFAPVAAGLRSFILINAVFEKAYTWSLPVIVGGISYPTPHNENWGNLQNINERVGGGFTYVVEHEASHALGLLHPHDSIGVGKDANGDWNYYYYTWVWLPDSTQSPTTYSGVVFPYGVWDQDNLMRGHSAEYIQMAQDAIADAYFEAGKSGIGSIDKAPEALRRERLMRMHLQTGRSLFARGDYLHAEYAFRNAYLAAAGVAGPELAPKSLAQNESVYFQVNSQGGLSRSESLRACGRTSVLGSALAATGTSPAGLALGLVLLVAAAMLARWGAAPQTGQESVG